MRTLHVIALLSCAAAQLASRTVARLGTQAAGPPWPMPTRSPLAVAEAVFVARLLEVRSIYSGRIHTGTQAARQREEHVPRISSAARYLELLHALMRMGRDATPLKVIDERGELIGEIPPDRVILTAESRRPLEIATARDFIIEDPRARPTGRSRWSAGTADKRAAAGMPASTAGQRARPPDGARSPSAAR